MDPAPAPLVYINGGHGIGKETVAECLTLLLGRDKSLLIDVRSVGRETAGTRSPKHHHHTHRHDGFDPGYDHNSPLITPEHPRYFSPDHFNPDHDQDHEQYQYPSDLPTPSSSSSSSRSTSFSSATTTTTAASTDLPTTTSISPSNSLSSTDPLPETYCSTENLLALLAHPPNRNRIAILPARTPDTPAGRAALRAFETAAARAGRVFVCIELACEKGELARRSMSLPMGALLPLGGGGGPSLGAVAVSGGGGPSLGVVGGPLLGVATAGGGGGAGRRGSFGFAGGGGGGGGEKSGRRVLSLPVPLEVAEVDAGVEALAVPVRAGLTVDVTRVPAFEAALQIVEFVRGLDGDAELCGGYGGGGRGRDEDDDDTTPVPVGRVEKEELAGLR